MATDWISEALPVLRAVYELQRELGPAQVHGGVMTHAVRERVDLEGEPDVVGRTLVDLVRTGYLDEPFRSDVDPVPTRVRLGEKGLQAVANWPAMPGVGSYDLLIAAITERLENAPTEAERSRWQRVRDGLLDLGRETVTELIARAAAGQVPGMG